jgi:hypothetical protein
MSNIEAIIVDGVRYDKKVSICDINSCDECELREIMCANKGDWFPRACRAMIFSIECWVRHRI